MKILIIEDEKRVATLIKKGLDEHNYTVDIAFDGETGKTIALYKPYDLIILAPG